MSRNNRAKKEAKQYRDLPMVQKPLHVVEFEEKRNKLEPLNESQRQYISSLSHDEIVIGAGKAGTGKTYISSRVAAQHYRKNKNIKKLILTRPNVEVGRSMGFLPGELHEKYAPFLEPFEKGLKEELGLKFDNDLHKNILPQPIAYMRGKTFDNAIILVDEAQNLTIDEMKVIITRIGTGSRLFITGDNTSAQDDLRVKENGLQWLIRQVRTQQKPIDIIEFTKEDCVRSELCLMMLDIIENEK